MQGLPRVVPLVLALASGAGLSCGSAATAPDAGSGEDASMEPASVDAGTDVGAARPRDAAALEAPGSTCNADVQCLSGSCTDGTCALGEAGSACVLAKDCVSGACTDGLCAPGTAGSPCAGDADCFSGDCVAKVCAQGAAGSPCDGQSDCASGVCTSGICEPG